MAEIGWHRRYKSNCEKGERYAAAVPGTPKPIAFLKLHKVGSTTVHDVLACNYVLPNQLRACRDDSCQTTRALSLSNTTSSSTRRLRAAAPKDRDMYRRCAPGYCGAAVEHDSHSDLLFERRGLEGYAKLLGPTVVTVVILRDPVERLLSRYFYDVTNHASGDESNAKMKKLGWVKGADGSWTGKWKALDRWIAGDKGPREGQHYLRAFARIGDDKTLDCGKGQCKSALAAATEALRRFQVVGVLERSEPFWDALCAALGLPRRRGRAGREIAAADASSRRDVARDAAATPPPGARRPVVAGPSSTFPSRK